MFGSGLILGLYNNFIIYTFIMHTLGRLVEEERQGTSLVNKKLAKPCGLSQGCLGTQCQINVF